MFESYDDLMRLDDVCEVLGIGKTKAYRLMRQRELPAFQIGREWRISKQSMIDYVLSSTKMAANKQTVEMTEGKNEQ